jgi:hypothetical protein
MKALALAPWGCDGSMWGHGCAERRSPIALLSKVSWSNGPLENSFLIV